MAKKGPIIALGAATAGAVLFWRRKKKRSRAAGEPVEPGVEAVPEELERSAVEEEPVPAE